MPPLPCLHTLYPKSFLFRLTASLARHNVVGGVKFFTLVVFGRGPQNTGAKYYHWQHIILETKKPSGNRQLVWKLWVDEVPFPTLFCTTQSTSILAISAQMAIGTNNVLSGANMNAEQIIGGFSFPPAVPFWQLACDSFRALVAPCIAAGTGSLLCPGFAFVWTWS